MNYYSSIRNHITRIMYVAVLRMIIMPSCPYFIFIDTSISKHVDIFFDFGFSLEDKRGLTLGELIRPFCIMLYISIFIALWAVITHYVTILMPILSYFTRFT